MPATVELPSKTRLASEPSPNKTGSRLLLRILVTSPRVATLLLVRLKRLNFHTRLALASLMAASSSKRRKALVPWRYISERGEESPERVKAAPGCTKRLEFWLIYMVEKWEASVPRFTLPRKLKLLAVSPEGFKTLPIKPT